VRTLPIRRGRRRFPGADRGREAVLAEDDAVRKRIGRAGDAGTSVLDRFHLVSQVHVRLALGRRRARSHRAAWVLHEPAGRVDRGKLNGHDHVVGILDDAIEPVTLRTVLSAPALVPPCVLAPSPDRSGLCGEPQLRLLPRSSRAAACWSAPSPRRRRSSRARPGNSCAARCCCSHATAVRWAERIRIHPDRGMRIVFGREIVAGRLSHKERDP
jgi:hypothetical protein